MYFQNSKKCPRKNKARYNNLNIESQLLLITEIARVIDNQSNEARQLLSTTEKVVYKSQSMKKTAQLQRQKNQDIQDQLGKLTTASSTIENRVKTQIKNYQTLENLISKIKKIFDSNQSLITQLDERISTFEK